MESDGGKKKKGKRRNTGNNMTVLFYMPNCYVKGEHVFPFGRRAKGFY